MRNRCFWIYLLGVFSLFFLLSGCSDFSLPTEEGAPSLSGIPPDDEFPGRGRGYGLYVKKIMGEKGGTVHLWHHSITIPRGALEENTWVSIRWRDLSLPVLDFGPEGLSFVNDQPAKIRISYRGGIFGDLDLENLHVIRWDEEEGLWTPIGGIVNREEEYVEVYVAHLSRYALSDR